MELTGICERVVWLRTQWAGPRGRVKFAEALGVGASTYNYYEHGRVPPAEVLVRAARVTGASLEWLLTGEGDAYAKAGARAAAGRGDKEPYVKTDGGAAAGGGEGKRTMKTSSGAGASGVEGETVRRLRELLARAPHFEGAVRAFLELVERAVELPEGGRRRRRAVAGAAEVGAAAEARRADAERSRQWVPVIGRTAAGPTHFWAEIDASGRGAGADRAIERLLFESAPVSELPGRWSGRESGGGKGATVSLVQLSAPDERGVVEFVDAADVKARYPDAVAWRVDGDSMAPRYREGDLVLVSPSVAAKRSRPCIARLRGQIGVTCKIYRRRGDEVWLVPLNKKYAAEGHRAGQVQWALEVLWSVRVGGKVER